MSVTTEADFYTYYYKELPDGGILHSGILQYYESGSATMTSNSGTLEVDAQDADTKQSDFHPSIHDRGFVHSANIGICITICTIMLNLIVIFLVIVRRSTRRQLIYQQVMSLAMADLTFGVVADPFTIYFELQPWRLANWFCVFYQVMDTALPFVSFIVLVALNLDRVYFAVSPSMYHNLFRHLGPRLLMLAAPWVLGLGLVLPLWLLSATTWPADGMPGVCMYGITKQAAVASSVLTLYLPCVVVIVLTVFLLFTLIGDMPQDVTELSALRSGPPFGGGAGGWGGHGRQAPYLLHGVATRSSPHANHLGLLTAGSRREVNIAHSAPQTAVVRTSSQDSGGGDYGRSGSDRGPGAHVKPRPERNAAAAAGYTASAEQAGRPSPWAKKSHRGLAVSLCVLNLMTVITQLPYGAISMLQPVCAETSCLTIKLMQAMGWMRSATYSLHPLAFLFFTHLRHACCDPCETQEEGGGELEEGDSSRRALSPSALTKSEHVELTSAQMSGSQINLSSPPAAASPVVITITDTQHSPHDFCVVGNGMSSCAAVNTAVVHTSSQTGPATMV